MAVEETKSLSATVAAHPLWYHSLALGDGIETPGWFDLRPIAARLPWPQVEGKRCLDVGPWDGYYAFELERRGAREVIAADIGDPGGWDWAVADRISGPAAMGAMAGESNGAGFEIARAALGSAVERIEISVYDLTPERIGQFDVVTCGSLMLHLRDPIRALEAIRSVCDGTLMSVETIDPSLSRRFRRLATVRMEAGVKCRWWVPNPAAHRAMVEVAGFEVEQTTGAFSIPLAPGHPGYRRGLVGAIARRAPATARLPGAGVPHAAVLAHSH